MFETTLTQVEGNRLQVCVLYLERHIKKRAVFIIKLYILSQIHFGISVLKFHANLGLQQL